MLKVPSSPLPEGTFLFFNAILEQRAFCLWLSIDPLSRKETLCPSLQSRLLGMNCVPIHEPDDQLLENVLKKAFRDRGVDISDAMVKFLVCRMERSFAAVDQIVSQVHDYVLSRKCKLSLTTLKKALNL